MNDKQKMKFSCVDYYNYQPTSAEEIEVNGNKFINWGKDNQFPYYIYDLYSRCATLQSIINGSVDYTIGNGININYTPASFLEENVHGDTLEDVIHKLVYDLWIFGGFAFQVQYNTYGEITELIYLDFRKCRTDKKCKYVYYCDKWGKYGQNRSIRYNVFDKDTIEESNFTQVYYYKGMKTRGVYPIPDYSASFTSAETQIKIQEFHYNNICNNFSVNGMLNFNNAADVEDEVKDEIERKVIDKFTGVNNAGRLMLSWNDNKEHAVTFERLSDDSFDKKYETLAESTMENLFISMRAIPVLFGLTVQTGFNSQEYQDAFALYNKTMVMPKQNELVRVFNKVFDNDNSISFEQFNIDFTEA